MIYLILFHERNDNTVLWPVLLHSWPVLCVNLTSAQLFSSCACVRALFIAWFHSVSRSAYSLTHEVILCLGWNREIPTKAMKTSFLGFQMNDRDHGGCCIVRAAFGLLAFAAVAPFLLALGSCMDVFFVISNSPLQHWTKKKKATSVPSRRWILHQYPLSPGTPSIVYRISIRHMASYLTYGIGNLEFGLAVFSSYFLLSPTLVIIPHPAGTRNRRNGKGLE